MKTYNENDQSAWLNVLVTKTLQLQLPAALSYLSANSATKNSFILSWKDNANNESVFQIFELVDLNGCIHPQKVINDSNQPSYYEFDLNHLRKGIYYFRLILPTVSTTQKIILS